MNKVFSVKEYDSFTRNKKIDANNYIDLPELTFDNLEEFVLSNKADNGTEVMDIMTLSSKKGIGKVIGVKNYVGIIIMNDGVVIEILPKIYSHTETSNDQSKQLLLNMLKALKNSPFKSLQSSDMNVRNLPVFEIFIRMFIKEVFIIAKRGLKCNYEAIQSNESFFKGKIMFSQHIKYNNVHKERIYLEYDDFNTNRPENKLIKSTLEYLYLISNSSKNKKDIKTLLTYFSEVEESDNYKSDFKKISIDRNLKDYRVTIQWCEVFLSGKSFTAFSGSEIATALLFPMETLFESYVASEINKYLDKNRFSITTQDKCYHLFDYPKKKFLIKPDIVVKNKLNKDIFVLDTKWKVLSRTKHNYGISQGDMYQMYAYQKKYHSLHVTLLYPYTDKVSYVDKLEFQALDGVLIKIRFIDLMDMKTSIKEVLNEFSHDTKCDQRILRQIDM